MFKNKHTTSPSDVQDGDKFAIKVVAVAGTNNDWAAYQGPTDWSDALVAASGDKLAEMEVGNLFYVLAASGRHYRE